MKCERCGARPGGYVLNAGRRRRGSELAKPNATDSSRTAIAQMAHMQTVWTKIRAVLG